MSLEEGEMKIALKYDRGRCAAGAGPGTATLGHPILTFCTRNCGGIKNLSLIVRWRQEMEGREVVEGTEGGVRRPTAWHCGTGNVLTASVKMEGV